MHSHYLPLHRLHQLAVAGFYQSNSGSGNDIIGEHADSMLTEGVNGAIIF